MGIYDQLHGECPHCGTPISIQTKAWITHNRDTSYDFYFGDFVPFLTDHRTGQPIVDSFHETCYICKNQFLVTFDVYHVHNERGEYVYKVVLEPFEPVVKRTR